MKNLLIKTLVLSAVSTSSWAYLPHVSEKSNTNFSRTKSSSKTIETCSSERIDVTRLVKTKYVKSSRISLKKFTMLPSFHGGYFDLIKDLRKNHLNEGSVKTIGEINKMLTKNNCEIYLRQLPQEDRYDYKNGSVFIVYNSCTDGGRDTLPESTRNWLEVVDASCEL